jgi:hypothetical protein
MLKKLRKKIQAESMRGNMQVEELELQIADLTANFRNARPVLGRVVECPDLWYDGQRSKAKQEGRKEVKTFPESKLSIGARRSEYARVEVQSWANCRLPWELQNARPVFRDSCSTPMDSW